VRANKLKAVVVKGDRSLDNLLEQATATLAEHRSLVLATDQLHKDAGQQRAALDDISAAVTAAEQTRASQEAEVQQRVVAMQHQMAALQSELQLRNEALERQAAAADRRLSRMATKAGASERELREQLAATEAQAAVLSDRFGAVASDLRAQVFLACAQVADIVLWLPVCDKVVEKRFVFLNILQILFESGLLCIVSIAVD
jgi:hypothetical protein